jgi:CRISPR/Cas system-associated exonuclease Cas4 (RecB family)
MLTYGDTKDTIKAKSREVLYQAIKVLKHTGMDEGDFKNEFVFGDYLRPFELEPGLKIQGSIDWMKDTSGHLVVSDFKTSRDFTYVKPLQLVLYSLALEKLYKTSKIEAFFLMVRSGAKFNVPITIESKAIALHLLREVNSNILAGKFEPKPSSKVCNDCVFRNTCPSSYVKTGSREITF